MAIILRSTQYMEMRTAHGGRRWEIGGYAGYRHTPRVSKYRHSVILSTLCQKISLWDNWGRGGVLKY
jgi:hypothetical protein